MIQLLDKNGQPLKINTKTILLAVVMGFGGFTGGASFPDLNPLNLLESNCTSE